MAKWIQYPEHFADCGSSSFHHWSSFRKNLVWLSFLTHTNCCQPSFLQICSYYPPFIDPSQKINNKGMIFLGNLPKNTFSFKRGWVTQRRGFQPEKRSVRSWKMTSCVKNWPNSWTWALDSCWAKEKPFRVFDLAWKGRKRGIEIDTKKHPFQ